MLKALDLTCLYIISVAYSEELARWLNVENAAKYVALRRLKTAVINGECSHNPLTEVVITYADTNDEVTIQNAIGVYTSEVHNAIIDHVPFNCCTSVVEATPTGLRVRYKCTYGTSDDEW